MQDKNSLKIRREKATMEYIKKKFPGIKRIVSMKYCGNNNDKVHYISDKRDNNPPHAVIIKEYNKGNKNNFIGYEILKTESSLFIYSKAYRKKQDD